MKRIALISLALVIILSSQTMGRATVGPVKVELNVRNSRLSFARANSATSFKIYMRYNIDIKPHDWIKVWFPSSEAVEHKTPEDLIKNVCDGFPKIDEHIINPRFIPNEEYFKKFDNPELKEYKQLYEMTDHDGEVNLYDCPNIDGVGDWEDVSNAKDGKRKVIKDPSGLGCWMLGTVFPSMIVEKKEREKWLVEYSKYIKIGYCPCCWMPFTLSSTCEQRLLTYYTPLPLEANRKGYNEIDLNVHLGAGFISPATPGRYRVAVATESEPVPVESESFILPCSDISDVSCNATEFGFSSRNPFTVTFRTGEGGALDSKHSTILIKLPEPFSISPKFSKNLIKVNGTRLDVDPEMTKIDGQTIVKLVSPVDANNFSKVNVVFDIFTHVTFSPGFKDDFVEVSTSSEPNFVKSEALLKLKETSLTIQPPEEYRESSISIRFLLEDGQTYPPQTQVKVILPEAFTHSEKITKDDVLINGVHPATNPKISGNTIEMTAPSDIKNKLVVAFLQSCAIVNPSVGFYMAKLEIGSDRYLFDDIYIQPAKARIENLVMSSIKPKTYANLSFDFKPSTFGNLEVDDEISIQFPQNFILPKSLDREWITVNKVKVENAKIEGTRLLFKSPVKQVVSGKYKYVISIGMRLPEYVTGMELILFVTSKGDSIEESLGTEEAYGQEGN